MFFQLGNIIFKGLFSPTAFSIEGDEATYAEHELIGSKTRLKKTGDTLQEINMDITFHAEFCKPAEQLSALKAAKDNGTILPFLWGDGRYVNDYVVIKFPYTIDEAFDDGTIIKATVNLTIREYVSYNELERKQLDARKSAFAVGNKNPLPQRPPQTPTAAKQLAQTVTGTRQQTTAINNLVSDMQNNTAQAAVIGKKIMDACKKTQDNVQKINAQLDDARAIDRQFNNIRSAAGNVSASVQGIINLFPFTNLNSLAQANTLLQGSASSMSTTTSGLMNRVITRQPIPDA